MYYGELLTKYNLQLTDVSVSIRKKAGKYDELSTAIASAEEELASEQDDKKKTKLQTQITDSKATLDELEHDLERCIIRFDKNKESYRANSERFRTLNQNRTGKPKNNAPSQDNPDPTLQQQQQQQTEPASTDAPASNDAPAANDDQPSDKKKSGGWGWLLAGTAAIVGVVIGVNVYQNRN